MRAMNPQQSSIQVQRLLLADWAYLASHGLKPCCFQ